jgi:hypothetical protein
MTLSTLLPAPLATTDLPSAVANANGTISIPAGTAAPNTSVAFYIEGKPVGNTTVKSDGSALLTPTYPPQQNAKVTYNALKNALTLLAPAITLPAYDASNTNILTNSNDLASWSKTNVTITNLDGNTAQIVTTANTAGNHAILNGLALADGYYTIGATVVRTAGTGSLEAKAFFPSYATASDPNITTGVPYRTFTTFQVTPGSRGSSAVQNIALSSSLANGAISAAGTFTVYNVTLAVGNTDSFGSANTAAQLVPYKGAPTDYTQQHLTVPNWPTDAPFTNQAAVPTNCSLQANAKNIAYYDFTPTGNCKDRETLEKHFFFSGVNPGYAPSNRSMVNVTNAWDGVDGGISYGRFRTYPKGHIYDLHKFKSDGLYLDVVGEYNDKAPYVYPLPAYNTARSHVYCGYIRPQIIVRPGMTVEFIIKAPSDLEGWGPTWLHGHTQISPGRVPASGGDPLFGYQTNAAGQVPGGFTPGPVQKDYTVDSVNGNQYQLFYELSHKGKSVYGEFDIPDAWNHTSNNPAYIGRTMSGGIVNGSVSNDEVDTAYHNFFANSAGYQFTGGPTGVAIKTGGTSLTETFHSFVLNWRNDGSNLVDFICDGVVFVQGYKEFFADPFWNILTHQVESLGYMIMIGGQYGRGFSNQNPYTPDGGTKGLLIKSFAVWDKPLDMSTVTVPANGLSNYAPLTLSSNTASANSLWTANITGVHSYPDPYNASVTVYDTKVRATASDGTVLTVTGNTATRTISGTFPTANTVTIQLKQIPYLLSQVALGIPTTQNLVLTVVAAAVLSALALSTKTINTGNPYSARHTAQSTGSTLTSATSDDSTVLTIGGSSGNNTINGKFVTGTTKTLTVVETLNGSTNSPRTSSDTVTVVTQYPTGNNVVTDQTIGGTFWTIGTANSAPSILVTSGAQDVANGTSGQILVPSTNTGLHRFSKVVTGLTANTVYDAYAVIKRYGTGTNKDQYSGPSSRYWFMNCTTLGRVCFDLQTLTAVVDSANTPTQGYFIEQMANGFYKVGLRGLVTATSLSVFPAFSNALSTDDGANGSFLGDGAQGMILSSITIAKTVA